MVHGVCFVFILVNLVQYIVVIESGNEVILNLFKMQMSVSVQFVQFNAILYTGHAGHTKYLKLQN